MKFEKNESALDRMIRVSLGIAFLVLGLFVVTGILKIVLIVAGLVSLVTGIVGFCGLYALLGISTLKK